MIDLKEQSKLFNLIGKELKEKTEVIAIGGTAMMLYGVKELTKDIDIVTTKKQDFDVVKKALENIGFKEKELFKVNTKYAEVEVDKPIFLVQSDKRIDLFLNKIICFKMTDTMQDRIEKVYEYNNLIIKVVAPEDIILLKCATDRAGDRKDAFDMIYRFNIKWDIIVNEAEHQAEVGQDVFLVYLFDFLEELYEDFKADIPRDVIKKIRKIAERQMIDVLAKKKKK